MNGAYGVLCNRLIAGLETDGERMCRELKVKVEPRIPEKESCSEYNERLLKEAKSKACELLAGRFHNPDLFWNRHIWKCDTCGYSNPNCLGNCEKCGRKPGEFH